MKNYPDKATFLKTFNPDLQAWCADGKNTHHVYYNRKAPCIGVVAHVYGQEFAELWIAAQLYSVDRYAGTKDKMSTYQINELSRLILSNELYRTFGVCEIMRFVAYLKSGKYGEFYGAVCPIKIAVAFRKFVVDRAREIDEIEQQRKEAEEAKEAKRRRNTDYAAILAEYEEEKRRKKQEGEL